MDTITVDSLQQKINSIAELIGLQSKEFDELLRKERAEREKSKNDFDERLEKSKNEFDELLKKERAERELSKNEFDELLKKERAERERASKELNDLFERDHKRLQKDLKAIDSKHEEKYSYFIEALVEPGIIDLFEAYNIHLSRVYPNVIVYGDDKQKLYEIDLWIINDKYIVVVETKTTMRTEYIKSFEKKLEIIRNNPPKEFKTEGKEIIGCFAAMRCNDEIAKHAIRSGFFVLYQKGNLLGIKNEKDFNFKTWKITK